MHGARRSTEVVAIGGTARAGRGGDIWSGTGAVDIVLEASVRRRMRRRRRQRFAVSRTLELFATFVPISAIVRVLEFFLLHFAEGEESCTVSVRWFVASSIRNNAECAEVRSSGRGRREIDG